MTFLNILIFLMIIGFFGCIFADYRGLWIFAPNESPDANTLRQGVASPASTSASLKETATQEKGTLRELRRRTSDINSAAAKPSLTRANEPGIDDGSGRTGKRVSNPPKTGKGGVTTKIVEVKEAEKEAVATKIAAAKLEAAEKAEAQVAEAKLAEEKNAEAKIAEAIRSHKEEAASKIAEAKLDQADRAADETNTEEATGENKTQPDQAGLDQTKTDLPKTDQAKNDIDKLTSKVEAIDLRSEATQLAVSPAPLSSTQEHLNEEVASHAAEVGAITADILDLETRILELEENEAKRARDNFWEQELTAKIASQKLEVDTIKIEIGQLSLRAAELESRNVV